MVDRATGKAEPHPTHETGNTAPDVIGTEAV